VNEAHIAEWPYATTALEERGDVAAPNDRADAPNRPMRPITMGPSQLGFILADCERCFVREVRDGVRRPGMVPEIFNLADKAMKDEFGRRDLIDLETPGIPRFKLLAQNCRVESTAIPFEALGVAVKLAGRLDALVETEDGRRFVVDYKTAVKPVPVDRYRAQLGAYALALAWPRDGVEPVEVGGTALLVMHARHVGMRPNRLGVYGEPEWIDIERDDVEMVELLRHAAALVAGAEQPRHRRDCAYCIYYGAVPLPAERQA
jgi:hypothetical protein